MQDIAAIVRRSVTQVSDELSAAGVIQSGIEVPAAPGLQVSRGRPEPRAELE
jgi:hypothetical protein